MQPAIKAMILIVAFIAGQKHEEIIFSYVCFFLNVFYVCA